MQICVPLPYFIQRPLQTNEWSAAFICNKLQALSKNMQREAFDKKYEEKMF